MVQDGSLAKLAQLPGRVGPPGDLAGWMGDIYPPDMHFTYLAGALFQADAVASEGFIYRDIEPGEMADILAPKYGRSQRAGAYTLMAQPPAVRPWPRTAMSMMHLRGIFEIEFQSDERYYAPLERGEQRHARLLLAVQEEALAHPMVCQATGAYRRRLIAISRESQRFP